MSSLDLTSLRAPLAGGRTPGAVEGGPRLSRHTLQNGLTVILQENHASPVVAFNVWVKVGSGDETDAESGLAHVLEHMVFKGTQRRQVGQIAQEVEGAGGDINAFTSFDQTVYHVVLASRFFDTGLDIVADVVRNSAFDPEELKKELEVVIEEVKRGEDIPSRRLSQALFQETYRVHPYRRPVIGTTRLLRTFRRPAIVDFFRKWYVPENMALVVAGDFQAAQALPHIREAFEDWASRPVPERPRPPEPEQTGMRVVILEDNVQEAHLDTAFHIPALNHEDVYALDVLSLVAGQGESSRLHRRVKDELGLVHSVSSSAYTPKDPGVWVAGAVLEPEKLTAALQAILRELYALKDDPPSDAELEKAKLNIEADFIFRRETIQGQAQGLGYFETVAGNLDFEKDYVERIRALTPEAIREAARKYLKNENLTIAVLTPEAQAAFADEGGIRAAAEAAVNPAAEARTPSSAGLDPNGHSVSAPAGPPPGGRPGAGVHREILPNGVTLLIKENPSIPTVAVRAVYLGGTRFEDEKRNGINNFIADLLTRGTERHTAAEFATRVDSLAAGISGFSGRNSLGVAAESLARFFDPLIDLLTEAMLHPAFDPEEVEKSRRDILAEIKREEDNLSQSAFKLFFRTLYGQHPYALPVNGTADSVRSIRREDLLAYYRSVTAPDNLVLAVVGDIRTETVVRRMKEAFGQTGGEKFSLPVPTPASPPETSVRKVVHREKKQAHITFGFLGATLDDADRHPLEILNAVLSSQGGRLFLELRDKQSLAYSVSSFHFEGLDPGALGVYIATTPEKVETALKGIRQELQELRSTPISSEELERAKKYIIGGYEIDLQRNGAQAADMSFNERYGLGWDEFMRFPERITALTAEDVLRAARKYIRLDAPVLGIVTPGKVDGSHP